jgi:hypothetical protein
MEKLIVFDVALKESLLDILGYTTDSEHYIVEKNNPGSKAITIDGEPIKINELAGITKGSRQFYKKDIFSLMKLADKLI